MMKDITRRAFLKTGAALSSVLLCQNALAGMNIDRLLDDGFVTLRNGRFLQVKPTTCTECPAGCGIIGFVDRGGVVSIHGNPKDPNSLGKICAKGIAAINELYDPERVLHPLKRIGKRGEGRWERISWDAALQLLASRLQEVEKSRHGEAFVFDDGGEAAPGIILSFLSAFGSPTYFNCARFQRATQIAACSQTLGVESVVPDLSRSNYILNFGANPYEHHEHYVPLIHRLINNRVENSAKLITFDVRLSNTAAKSDTWIPCRPGSDGFLAMAMANVILRNRLHDKDFVRNWMNCTEEQLRGRLAAFTPEDAETISGVRGEETERLAVEFAREKPAVAISGNGVWMQSHGTYGEMAILLLNGVTGNIDIRGGLCLPRSFPLGPGGSETLPASGREVGEFFSELQGGDRRVSAYLAYKANPAYSRADCRAVRKVLEDEKLIPLVAVVDTHLTETAKFADIVLPAALTLESWGIESRPSLNFVAQLNVIQPVIPPRGEAKEIGDILIRVADMMGQGLKSRFPFKTSRDYVEAVLTRFPELIQDGGLARLRTRGVWSDPQSRPVFKLFEGEKFRTPSGKYEVFPIDSLRGNQDLPSVLRPEENTGRGVRMSTFHSGLRSSRNSNCKWLAEISHENRLWMHPETASASGVGEGDEVEITSEAGSVRVRARITWGIEPGIVALARGFGHEECGSISRSRRFSSKDPDTKLIWWNPAKSDVNANVLVPVSLDPVSGGQAWNGIAVRLKKC